MRDGGKQSHSAKEKKRDRERGRKEREREGGRYDVDFSPYEAEAG